VAEPKGPVIEPEKIRLFEKTEAQLEGFFEEIGNISKKKPDDAINKFKLGFINQMLESANQLLGDEYRPFPDFTTFDLDTLPSASDVVTMLSQYLRTLDKFRSDHSHVDVGGWYWNVPKDTPKLRAKRPKKFDS
jgi:hypothetical protein